MNSITFTPNKLLLLKLKYAKAVTDGAESFVFEEHELLVTYAKYLIEYLEGRMK